MRKTSKRRAVTLIELMLVMGLIAVALGAMALPITSALKGEQFERGVDQLIAKITLAQEIMLDFRTNLHLSLEQKEGEVICTLEADTPLPPRIERALNYHPKISGVTQMAFGNEIKNQIELSFDGNLGFISHGVLTFYGSGGKEAAVTLYGYPKQIRRGNHDQTPICTVAYPEEIFSAL